MLPPPQARIDCHPTSCRRLVILAVAVTCVVTCVLSAPAFAAPPELTAIFPMGGAVGSFVEVEITGKNLGEGSGGVSWWFPVDGIEAEHLEKNRYRLTIDLAVPIGAVDAWVATSEGLAGPRRFYVSSDSVLLEQEGSESARIPQVVPVPGVVDAKLDRAADIDYFAFDAQQGECITLSCRSHSMDCRVRPVVFVVGPSGEELLHSRGNRLEPTLTMLAPVSGRYRFVVHDRAYQLNAPAQYRVELKKGRHVVAAFPHIISDDTQAVQISEYKPQIDPSDQTDLSAAAQPQDSNASDKSSLIPSMVSRVVDRNELFQKSQLCDQITDSAAIELNTTLYSIFDTTSRVSLATVASIVTVEDELAAESPLTVELPAVVAGRFLDANDVDWYQFQAKKDQLYQLQVFGARLSQLMDVELAICDATGKVLLELKDTAAAKGLPATLPLASLDPSGEWKAPADGEYLIGVRDLFGGSVFGPDRVYELRLRAKTPSTHVVILPANDKLTQGYSTTPGAELPISVAVLRAGGCKRPIRLSLADDQPGVTAEALVIAGNATSAVLKLKIASVDGPGVHEIKTVQLVATVDMESENPLSVPVSVLGTLHPGTPTPTRRTEQLLVHVGSGVKQ